MPGLFRSRSLPHYLGCGTGDSGLGSLTHARPAAEIRQLITLRQHYYPEGGWGWLVLGAALLVQVLSHGLQLAAGLLYTPIQEKFAPPRHPALAGELPICFPLSQIRRGLTRLRVSTPYTRTAF